jgi:hypothetical protein
MSVEWPCKGRIETTFGVSRVRFLDFDTPLATQSAELHLCSVDFEPVTGSDLTASGSWSQK